MSLIDILSFCNVGRKKIILKNFSQKNYRIRVRLLVLNTHKRAVRCMSSKVTVFSDVFGDDTLFTERFIFIERIFLCFTQVTIFISISTVSRYPDSGISS